MNFYWILQFNFRQYPILILTFCLWTTIFLIYSAFSSIHRCILNYGFIIVEGKIFIPSHSEILIKKMGCLCVEHTLEFSLSISCYCSWWRHWMFYSINRSFLWTVWTAKHDNISIWIRCFHCWILWSRYFKLFCLKN